jgi:hypothetical protein
VLALLPKKRQALLLWPRLAGFKAGEAGGAFGNAASAASVGIGFGASKREEPEKGGETLLGIIKDIEAILDSKIRHSLKNLWAQNIEWTTGMDGNI